MDFTQFNWLLVGFPVMAITLGVFVFFALKRQWTWGALLIGLAHLPFAFMHCVAPFRGLLDPNYVGYNSGLIRASNNLDVFVFAGIMLVGATTCAVIAVQNRTGLRNAFVLMFDFMVLLLFATPIFNRFLTGDFSGVRVEFGEYLQFGGTGAFLFEFGLIAVPFTAGLIWAWRKLTNEVIN